MIRELRKKFILVSMCSMLTVLTGIVGGILASGYGQIISRADHTLRMLTGSLEAGGTEAGGRPFVEPPYENRYFTVKLDETGQPVEIRRENRNGTTEEEAFSWAQAVWKKEEQTGFCSAYRYLKDERTQSVVFLDCARDLNSFYSTVRASILVSIAGFLLVLLLVLLLSKRVFRPVAESYEKQKQFITDASHELKTPLTIIDANTEVLEMTMGENQWTASIRKQIRRLTDLTRQLVELTRMEEGNRSKEMTGLSLSEVITEAAEPFGQVAEQEGKKLILSVEPDISGKGIESLLTQLVCLLLDNALKYSLEGSSIVLTFRKKGKKAELVVSNKTDMAAAGNQDILFERFYRTDASRNSETGGSGIGLSVAKAIVQVHRGRIHAFCEDGKTIVFTALWER